MVISISENAIVLFLHLGHNSNYNGRYGLSGLSAPCVLGCRCNQLPFYSVWVLLNSLQSRYAEVCVDGTLRTLGEWCTSNMQTALRASAQTHALLSSEFHLQNSSSKIKLLRISRQPQHSIRQKRGLLHRSCQHEAALGKANISL